MQFLLKATALALLPSPLTNHHFIYIGVCIHPLCSLAVAAARKHCVPLLMTVQGCRRGWSKSSLLSQHLLRHIPPTVCLSCPKMLRGKFRQVIFLILLCWQLSSMNSSSQVWNDGPISQPWWLSGGTGPSPLAWWKDMIFLMLRETQMSGNSSLWQRIASHISEVLFDFNNCYVYFPWLKLTPYL